MTIKEIWESGPELGHFPKTRPKLGHFTVKIKPLLGPLRPLWSSVTRKPGRTPPRACDTYLYGVYRLFC